MVRGATPETIKLQGGTLALDFANSVDWTEDERESRSTDALLEPDSLERWGRRARRRRPPGGRGGARRARAAPRRALHAIFSAARGETPTPPRSSRLRFAYAQAVAAGTLSPRDGAFGLDWPDDDPPRCASPSPPTRSRCSPTPTRLRASHRCPGRDCGWVFLNTSGRRRWCSMADLRQPREDAPMYARRLQQR